jgi:lipopolysaccharide transport system ATP-binding protein
MSDTIITIENLSKMYTIHHQNGRHPDDGLRHVLEDAFLAPWRWLRKVATANGSNGSGQLSSSDFRPPTSDFRSASSEEFWALKDISFDVKQGEVVGIIGRNGAGKSTLLKILSRITEPTEGEVRMKGRVASLLEVGTGFHPELTGRENVFLNGAILGMTKAEIRRKFDEIVAFAEVEKFLDTPVKRYSSGMYVRLAFAVAAHLDPEILIIDEVLAVGDADFQKKCLRKMDDAARGGRTVLFVSHNMAAVQSLCTRAIYLRDGQVVEDGPVSEAMVTYLSWAQQQIDGLSLAERRDREGGDQLRIMGVEFLDGETGNRLLTLLSGQHVLIRMHFECRAQKPMENVSFGIGFFTIDRSHLFTCSSDETGGLDVRLDPGVGTCICRIAKWPLRAGRYTFNVMANKSRVILDWVREAGYVDVEKGDYYGSGNIPFSSKSGVFVEHRWESSSTTCLA